MNLPEELRARAQAIRSSGGSQLDADLFAAAADALEQKVHCPTCQCARTHYQPLVPDNPRSRSWHKG